MRIARGIRSDDDGATSVEYAVMLAMILLACFAAVQVFGSAVASSFNNTSEQVEAYFPTGS